MEYDVFISFKHLGPDGTPTRDSQLAEEVFNHLTSHGFKVFFSKISLEQQGVDAYKRAIAEALDASTVLIAVGTSRNNLESRWVQYEWDSFHNEILSGTKSNGRVFVYVEGSQWQLPYSLRSLTVFRHGVDKLDKLSNYVDAQKTAERIARDAVAVEAERKREAAAREAERLEREAAEIEARRLGQEAAAREAERIEREVAAREDLRLRFEAAVRAGKDAELEVTRIEHQIATTESYRDMLARELGVSESKPDRDEELSRLINSMSVSDMTYEQATSVEAALGEFLERRHGSGVAELARATLDALVSRDKAEVTRLFPELTEALARDAAEYELRTKKLKSDLYAAQAARGFASVAHPDADPETAAAINIEYRKALSRWKSLPLLERIRTKRPPLPPGVMG